MPTLNINGQRVNVGDEFLQLSTEQQNATVEQIASQLGAQPEQQTQNQPLQQPQQAAAPQGSFLDPLAQGATFGFADEIAGGLGAGANTVANLFGAGTGESFGDAYQGIRDTARDRLASYTEANPAKALAAEIGGGLLTGGAGAARVGALKGAQSLGKLAGVGAAQGGIYGAGASEAEDIGGLLGDTAQGAALGGLTGVALPAAVRGSGKVLDKGVKKANRLLAGGNNAVRKKSIDILDKYGINLTAGQRGGSQSLRARETDISGIPFVGGPLADTFENQQTQVQKKILDMAGFASDDVSEGLIDNAAIERATDRFSKRYTEAFKDTNIDISRNFANSVGKIRNDFTNNLAGGPNAKVDTIVDEILERTTGKKLNGNQYQKLRSEIGILERRNKSNNVLGSLYSDLKTALDDEFINSSSKAAGVSKKKLDKEFGQFSQIKELVKRNAGGAGGTISGNLPISQLARIAQQRPGGQQWRDFLNAAASIIPDQTPNSGTGGRNLANSATFAGLGASTTGGIPGILGTLAAGAAGRAGSKALANPLAVKSGAQSFGRGVEKAGSAIDTLSPLSVAGLFSSDLNEQFPQIQAPLRGLL